MIVYGSALDRFRGRTRLTRRILGLSRDMVCRSSRSSVQDDYDEGNTFQLQGGRLKTRNHVPGIGLSASKIFWTLEEEDGPYILVTRKPVCPKV
jgi:hypothetical protein